MEGQNAGQNQEVNQDRRGGFGFGSILQMILIYYVITSLTSSLFASKDTQSKNVTPGYNNLLADHDIIDFSLYLSEDSTEKLIWHESGLTYDFDPSNNKEVLIKVDVTPSMLNNVTMLLLGEFTLHSLAKHKNFKVKKTKELTKWTTKSNPDKVNLLSGEVSKDTSTEKFLHWIPSIDVQIVHDTNYYKPFPPQIENKVEKEGFNYYPIIELSDFWVLKEHLVLINDTVTQLDLKLTFNIVWIYKYMMYTQFEQSQTVGNTYGLHSEGEFDIMKKMFLETNPYFLGLTMFISFIHMIFEFMAFKSEIEFWKGRESLKGLSTNLLLYNFIASIIIFFYLLDSGETSWAVWLPMGIGIFIDFWKITKGFDVKFSKTWPLITIKGKESHKEGGTNQLDNAAVKYLAYILIPVTIGYSIYGLYYYQYKSWLSWFIGTLASIIYTCGFIMMTPQLYINYKLQSVAHMPWKVLTYRALNTFIDDMFAFIIAMPTMHRLACLRDDVIFIVYLYQKWIYKVDPNRHYLDTETVEVKEEQKVSDEDQKKNN